jgi:hypothetical protein
LCDGHETAEPPPRRAGRPLSGILRQGDAPDHLVTSPSDLRRADFGNVPDPLAAAAPARPLRLPDLGPSPERTQVRSRRVAALIGSLGWLGMHLAVFGIRDDLGRLPLSYAVAQILLPFAVAVTALVVAMGSGKLGLGMRLGLVAWLAVLGPAAFAVIAAGAPVPSDLPAPVATLTGILVCFDLTVAWAAVPLLLAGVTLRGAFAAATRWRSALVGAGVGLFAGATMNLHCPNVAPHHMLAGHGLPVIIATVAGALLLALRARP